MSAAEEAPDLRLKFELLAQMSLMHIGELKITISNQSLEAAAQFIVATVFLARSITVLRRNQLLDAPKASSALNGTGRPRRIGSMYWI
jgi:hypothetical protein